MRILFTVLILLLHVSSSALTIAGGETFVIDDSQTIYVDELVMEANSTLINNGTLIFDSDFDFSYCYKTGVTFINNCYIECENFRNNINQWQWLATPVKFVQNGAFLCHQDFDCIVSAYIILSFGENASTSVKNVNIQKYGNSDLELLGSWLCDDIDITFNDGGRMIRLGDIECENFTLHNNAKNVQINGMAKIKNITGDTWGPASLTVDGALIIGEEDGVNVRGAADSFVSLCYNKTSGKDYNIYSDGTICYRVQYSADDNNYWATSPKDENDVVGQATLKANFVSYDECIEGYTHFLSIIATDGFTSEKGEQDAIIDGVYYDILGRKNSSSSIKINSSSIFFHNSVEFFKKIAFFCKNEK